MENNLKIVFENDNLFVIYKPSGVTVNRSDTSSKEETLQDFIDRMGKVHLGEDSEFNDRSGIVHRLDKETSGLIIIAKNQESFRFLQKEFKERRVEKTYLALAHGKIIPKIGQIIAPVGRLPWNRKRFGVLAGGKDSITSYEVIKEYDSLKKNETLSLIRLFPKTGRTHQIRVHLKYINHPIFSDPVYGGRKTSREDRKILDRVFLHAQSLCFTDPDSQEVKVSSEMPFELKELLEKLSKNTNNE